MFVEDLEDLAIECATSEVEQITGGWCTLWEAPHFLGLSLLLDTAWVCRQRSEQVDGFVERGVATCVG